MADPRDFWHILPHYAKRDVVHYLDFKTRCNLSYCSKSDLALVKSTPLAISDIHWRATEYRELNVIHFTTINCNSKHMIDADYSKQYVDAVCHLLRSPNTCETLDYNGPDECAAHQMMISLIEELDVQNIRPKIKGLKWSAIADGILHSFLTRIDANYLNKMVLCAGDETEELIERIVATEQWKNTKVVKILNSFDFTWRLEHVLDKPKFHITLEKATMEQMRQIIKTFQDKNHPVGSFFSMISFECHLNFSEMYENLGQPFVDSEEDCEYYVKTFPLPDEDLELRVQLKSIHPDSESGMKEVRGVVVEKDAEDKDAFDILSKFVSDG